MKRTRIFGILALIGMTVTALGQPVGVSPSNQFPRFTLADGQLDPDGFPISGAKLCMLSKEAICYQMPSETLSGSEVKYEFGLEPHAERLPRSDDESWVFFTAMFSGGGSGTLTRFAVLRYSGKAKTDKIVNLLPWVGATNVSEWAMWTVKGASPYPVLVRADFVWGKEETHFGSHFYNVEAWKFDPGSDRYEKALEYKTSRKYDGGDHSPIRVLAPERARIVRRLIAK
jgi:hypothetical protein